MYIRFLTNSFVPSAKNDEHVVILQLPTGKDFVMPNRKRMGLEMFDSCHSRWAPGRI